MHPSTQQVLQHFGYAHLPAGPLRDTSAKFHDLAHDLALSLPEGPELTTGLRKLLEAKDCGVRAARDLVLERRPGLLEQAKTTLLEAATDHSSSPSPAD